MTVILFDALGGAELTRGHDIPGLLDIFKDVRMERVTEIHLDPETRKFFIEWKLAINLDGEVYAKVGDKHDYHIHACIWGGQKPSVRVLMRGEDDHKLFLFDSYEDAIKYEVFCLDQLRRMGVRFT